MIHALLLCSDDACAAHFEAFGSVDEIEALACECGCCLEVIRWLADSGDEPGAVALLPVAA